MKKIFIAALFVAMMGFIGYNISSTKAQETCPPENTLKTVVQTLMKEYNVAPEFSLNGDEAKAFVFATSSSAITWIEDVKTVLIYPMPNQFGAMYAIVFSKTDCALGAAHFPRGFIEQMLGKKADNS